MRHWSFAMTLSLIVGSACAEQNDAWDGPITRDTDGREYASEASSGTVGSDVTSTSTTGGSSTTGTSGTSRGVDSTGAGETTTGGKERPALECPGNWNHACDEVCTNVKSDPLNCGIECIDCTQTVGLGAMCRRGICQPSDGNDDRDEPDDD